MNQNFEYYQDIDSHELMNEFNFDKLYPSMSKCGSGRDQQRAIRASGT